MAEWPVRQPHAGVDLIPQSGIYEFGYWAFLVDFRADGKTQYLEANAISEKNHPLTYIVN
jgi:hypothetical protein